MRVLLITPSAPSRAHLNGGATRIHRLYSGLIKRGHSVTVVAPFTADSASGIESLEREGFGLRPHVRWRSRLLEASWAVLRKPSLLGTSLRLASKELIAKLLWVDLRPLAEAELESGHHDVVVIEQSFAAPWRADLDTELPVLLVSHEVESVQLLAKGTRIGGLMGMARYINAGRTQRMEKRWTPQFDGVIVMSDDEAKLLRSIVGSSQMPATYVVGNGADVRRLATLPAPADDGRAVLFTGTLAYPPNAVGAAWLVEEVWPKLQALNPGAELLIVGAAPPRSVRELASAEHVSLHADVPEIIPWLEASTICLLPMLEGGGTRLKLLEAFAAGRAVVSTTNGAAGIDCTAGKELLIADSPDGFAQAISRLLNDPALRKSLTRRAHNLVLEKYDWDHLSGELENTLLAVCGKLAKLPAPAQIGDGR